MLDSICILSNLFFSTLTYFNDFNINDAESTFSEYDISDFSENEEEEAEVEA